MVGFSACMTKKKMARLKQEYEIFRTGLDSLGKVPKWEERVILPGDKITFSINTESVNGSQVEVFNNGKDLSYTVFDDSTILVAFVGRVKIAGMNRNRAVELLKKELSKYIKNPVVQMQPLEIQIVVFGQAEKQMVVSMPEKEANLLKALTLAGGVNQFSKRDSVIVIRETEGERKFIVVDLRNIKDFYASQAYKLENNDVVFIKPNDYYYKQLKNSETVINLGRLAPVTVLLGILFFVIPIWTAFSR